MALELELATRAGVPYGIVHGAGALSVTRAVKAPRTARFTLPEGHAFRQAVRLAPRTIAKVYDRDDAGVRTLKHVGPLTSYQRAAEESVVTTLGSTDAAWYLDRRVLLLRNAHRVMQKRGDVLKWIVMRLQDQAVTDAAYTATDAQGYPLYELSRMTHSFVVGNLVYQYTGAALDTGIRVRTIADTPTVLMDSEDYTKASSLFGLATAGLDGPDWHVYPTEPTSDANGVRLGYLDVAPTIGVTRDVTFEYGAGKRNVTAFEEVIDPSTQALAIMVNTPTGSVTRFDKDAFDLYGPLEDVIQTDIPSMPHTIINGVESGPGAMVSQLIADHLAVRKVPRQVITFTVAPDTDPGSVALEERRIPRPGIDYDFGDLVIFKATELVPRHDAEGTLVALEPEVTVNAWFRVYSVTESDDDNGQRVTQVTVVAA